MAKSITPKEMYPEALKKCIKVYEGMLQEARPIDDLDGQPGHLWEGSLMRSLAKWDVEQSFYSTIMANLQKMGCVTKVQRGAGGSPSLWAMHKEPTIELWHSIREVRRLDPKYETNRALSKRVNKVEHELETLSAVVYALAAMVGKPLENEEDKYPAAI